MKKYSLSALLAAGLLAGAATSASAADLGGNCCADLEERIAELEATTVRKGNRKVSLTVSGWVAEQVLWWDDGVESNAYVTGLGATLASNFKLTGEAQIRPGLKAGYVMHIELNTSDPLTVNQSKDDGPSAHTGRGPNVLDVAQSYWFLKDNHWGQVSVGQLSHASDNAAMLVDGSGSLVPANWVQFDNMSFNLRVNGALTGITWGDLGQCHFVSAGIGGDCNGVPLNAVRYDSPTLAGFSVSASWGEDDFWDVTGRWAGEHSGFKLAAAVSYAERTDNRVLLNSSFPVGDAQRVSYFQAAGYIEHVSTGLFLYGAYGSEHASADLNAATFQALDRNPDHFYLKAGVKQKWTPLGNTILFGEYGERNNMTSPAADAFAWNNTAIFGDTVRSEMRQWGLGVVQEIDAAAMSMFVVYRNFDGSLTATETGVGSEKFNFDSFQILKAGALINF